MPIIQKKYPWFVDWRKAVTGAPATRYGHGLPLLQSFLHQRVWRGLEYVGGYVGRPELATNGNGDCKFHVITGSPVKADTGDATRKMHIRQKNWRSTAFGAAAKTNTWYDTIGGASTSLQAYVSPSGTSDDWADGANGNLYDHLVDYTPVGTGVNDGFKMHRLDVANQLVATLSIWEEPEAGTVTSDQAILSASDIGVDQTLDGYDVSASDPGTIGALAYHQQTGDSVLHNTRRCLHQTVYPMSAWCEAASWTHVRQDSNSNPYTEMIKPRDLTGSNIIADLALCVTIDVPEGGDAGIRISSVTAGDTWTYTTSSDVATPTLITTSDGTSSDNGAGEGLTVQQGEDTFTLEAYADAGGSVEIHTISTWEPHTIIS